MNDKIRSAYSHREPVNNPFSGEPSRTKQEFVQEVNINEIVSRMKRGISPPLWMTSNTPRYGDFSNMPTSFQDAYNIIETADAAFKSLPLEFRRALDHNPRNLDKAPRELYEQFGLLKGKNSAGASPESDKTPGGTPQASPAPQGAAKTPKTGVKPTPQNADE
nr:MAG: internal scaffolding protein [Microvirus sp.]